MSYIVPEKMPMRCFECKEISSSTIDGYSCGITHRSLASEHGINVRRPDWCPLIECRESLFSANNARKFLKENPPKEGSET